MAEALARPGGAGAAHAALTVLAVDDDADVLRATERILLEAGFRVLTGTTAAEALELTCVFRSKPNTDSAASRTLIPRQAEH